MSYSHLKILHGKLELPTIVNNIFLNLEVHVFRYPGGRIQSVLVGVYNVKFGNPLASGGQSSLKLTPHYLPVFIFPKKES